MRLQDLAGKTFNELTVIKRVANRGNQTMWECLCSCGNTKNVPAFDIKSGKIKDCGCVYLKRIDEKKRSFNIGKRSGKLKVIDVLPNRKFKVVCDCGKEKIIPGNCFSKTRSCGCIRREKTP